MKLRRLPVIVALIVPLATIPLRGADAVKPLKVLLISGGCCHDYAKQKEILKTGLEARANVVVDEVYSGDKTDAPPIPMIYGNPEYAKGYDCIIHDECTSRIS